METRQTTNLKIAGSTPARLVFFEENKGKKKREKKVVEAEGGEVKGAERVVW